MRAVARPAWFTIPNAITLFRVALVPVFLVLQFLGHPGWALFVFVVAAFSDALDGFLARVLNQRSKFGGVMDPIADKLLVFAALVTLVYAGRLPLFLLALIAFRDGLMIIGALIVRRKRLEIPTSPSRIGKYATFSLTAVVVLSMVGQNLESAHLEAYTAVVGFIAALCVIVSTVQYLARFGYLFFAPGAKEGGGRGPTP